MQNHVILNHIFTVPDCISHVYWNNFSIQQINNITEYSAWTICLANGLYVQHEGWTPRGGQPALLALNTEGTPGRCFKSTYELLNLRALKFSPLNKIHIFWCMGMIFYVEFQRYPLKFHTKYLTHTLKETIFMQRWYFDLRAHTHFWNTPLTFSSDTRLWCFFDMGGISKCISMG